MKGVNTISRKKIYILIYILALTGLAVFFHSDHFLNGDEGVTLNGAWNIYNGRRLYVDFFSFLPPLSFYLIAWLWQLIGASFWSAKIMSVIFLLLGALGLYRIAEKVKPAPLNLLVPLFFILSTSWLWIINHNFYHLIFSIWSAYFFIDYLKERRLRSLVFSGIIAGLSILTLQQKGVVFTGMGIIFLLILPSLGAFRQRFKKALIYGLSALTPLIFLFIFWTPSVLWQNLVYFPLFNYIESNRISYWLLITTGCAFTSAVFALNKFKLRAAYLLFVSAGLLLSCYPLPDYYHLGLALSFMIPLLPTLLDFSVRGCSRWLKVIAISGLSWLWLWPTSVFIAFYLFNFTSISSYGFLDYVRRECPGKYLHVGPFLPNVYFETNKLSATSFDILITGHQTEAQFLLASQELAASSPVCALTAYPYSLERFHHNQNNPVDNFIRDHYQPVYKEGPVTVWKNTQEPNQ